MESSGWAGTIPRYPIHFHKFLSDLYISLLAVCQISTFALITEMYYNSEYPSFDQARPGESSIAIRRILDFIDIPPIGIAYVLHTITWILSIMISLSVLLTGVSADAGHRWAAGNRPYRPIA